MRAMGGLQRRWPASVAIILAVAAAMLGAATAPARADQVTQAVAAVDAQHSAVHRAQRLLRAAGVRHQARMGTRRLLRGRLFVSLQLRSSVSVHQIRKLRALLSHEHRLLARYPKRRLHLHRQLRTARHRLHHLERREQALIRAQARAQTRLANVALRRLRHHTLRLRGNPLGVHAVRIALKQLGTPYVWAGDTPSGGFDCSGLVMWVYGKLGVALPHFAASQAQLGKPVEIRRLQPGDLVFFEHPIGHVAMYVADGLLIEAPHTGDVVRITRLDDPWHIANYQGAVRIFTRPQV